MNYRDEFEKILEATKVNRMISQEEFNNRMQPMIQFIQRTVPAQLYKFSLNYSWRYKSHKIRHSYHYNHSRHLTRSQDSLKMGRLLL